MTRSLEDLTIRVLAFAFCATTFALVLTHEASALRRGGEFTPAISEVPTFEARSRRRFTRWRLSRLSRHPCGGMGRPSLLGRRQTLVWVCRTAVSAVWRGGVRLGRTPTIDPSYSYSYMGPSQYSATGAIGTTAATKAPGMCGTYFYWKGSSCVDARSK